MGVRILVGNEQGCDDEKAVLFDSVDGVAFGPLFDSEEEAEQFLLRIDSAVGVDPRRFSTTQLVRLRDWWRDGVEVEIRKRSAPFSLEGSLIIKKAGT